MNAFENYNQVLNTVNQRAVASNAHLEAASNIKTRGDEIMKTVGEAKVFMSGKSIGAKVGKAMKEKAEAKANQLLSEGKNRIGNAINQRVESLTQRAGSRLSNLRNQVKGSQSTRDSEASEGAEGDASGSNFADEAFDRIMGQTRGGTFQNPMANARANKVNPGEEDAQSLSDVRSTPNPSFDPDVDVEPIQGLENFKPVAGIKSQVVETAEKTGARAGEEEAGSGILDAVPGLDVIGVIGGAVMAGIAGHKAHKQEKLEESKQQNTSLQIGNEYQAGVGN